MARHITKGLKVVLGIPPETKPVQMLPAGDVTFQFSTTCIGRVWVKTETSLREFWLEDAQTHWVAHERFQSSWQQPRRIAHLPGADVRAFKTFSFK